MYVRDSNIFRNSVIKHVTGVCMHESVFVNFQHCANNTNA
jgi:hypothetical protein